MKKWLIAICLTISLLGLTACGKDTGVTYMANEDALSLCTSAVSLLQNVTAEGIEEQYVAQASAQGENGQMYKEAFESWSKAEPEIGEYLGIGEVKTNTVELDVIGMPKSGSVVIGLLGTIHDASLEIVFERGDIASITTNVAYSFGENMAKAGLNTLLGMGTVFVVLILISLLISAFKVLNKAQDKKEKDTPAKKAVDQTIAQIIEKEELSDDTELVAVIAAAIATYEGTSADGFVVRSIRRAR